MTFKNLSPANKKKIEDAYVSLLLSQTKVIQLFCEKSHRDYYAHELQNMFDKIDRTRQSLEKLIN